MEISGLTSRSVAKELREQDVVIKGHRDTALEHELNRYIPTAAEVGGMIVGGLSFVADLLGKSSFLCRFISHLSLLSPLSGSAVPGSSIVVVVTVIFQYYEIVLRESGGMLQNLLGEL